MAKTNVAIYLETIRKKKKLSIAEATKGIISDRQYRRYVLGESEIPYHILAEISNNLGFTVEKILGESESLQRKQYEYVEDIFNSIVRRNFERTEELLKIDSNQEFMSETIKLYFDVSMVLYDNYLEKLSKSEAKQKIYELVNYPKILEQDIFDPVELIILSVLTGYMEQSEKDPLINRLTDLLLEKKVTIGTEFYARQYITIRLAREHFINKNYQGTIDLCDNALLVSTRSKIHYNYDFLYYYIALAYQRLDNTLKAYEYLQKLYHYLLFIDEQIKFDSYTKKIKKDFGFKLSRVDHYLTLQKKNETV